MLLLGGVGKFYLNAILTGIISWVGTNDGDDIRPRSGGSVGEGFHAMGRLQGAVGGFKPPNPNENVQKQIDELTKDIADLEKKIAAMSNDSDVDKLKLSIAAMQDEINAITKALDNAAKQATNALQPEIDTLTNSLNSVSVNLFTLKVTVAHLADDLLSTQVSDITWKIMNNKSKEAIFDYLNYDFTDRNATMIDIATLGYKNCIVQDPTCVLKFLTFMSSAETDMEKLFGYEGLYYGIVSHDQLYKSALPFVVANQIAQLAYSSDGTVASDAKAFLAQVVNSIVASVVFQHSAGQKLQYQDGTAPNNGYCTQQGLSFGTPNYYAFDDSVIMGDNCAFAKLETGRSICFSLKKTSSEYASLGKTTLVTEIKTVSDPRSGQMSHATCQFYPNCFNAGPQNIDEYPFVQVYEGKMVCLTYYMTNSPY